MFVYINSLLWCELPTIVFNKWFHMLSRSHETQPLDQVGSLMAASVDMASFQRQSVPSDQGMDFEDDSEVDSDSGLEELMNGPCQLYSD